ncbi:MAG: AAA-like domain-containing protein [Armatimonadetes bacterium]|nr:AAA-like domain-containing protein [Armatimonadota bacterium]
MPATSPNSAPEAAGSGRFFEAGGSLGPHAPSYVVRRADTELHEALLRGELCYVLTPRQMGKSSLKVRTATRLKQEGLRVAVLDLTAIGRNLTVEQWCFGMLDVIGEQLGMEDEVERRWDAGAGLGPVQRFMGAVRQAASAQPLVLFIDEIDVVQSLPFSADEFLAAIREMHDRRATDPAAARVTFCLLGAASPGDLIGDPRVTPFNVGRRIELADFTREEAQSLAPGLAAGGDGGAAPRRLREAGRLLDRVMHWTGGHPYLTQRLCKAVAGSPRGRVRRTVDQACRGLFLRDRAGEADPNLSFVHQRLLRDRTDTADLLALYGQVLAGVRVAEDERDPLIALLLISGLVRRAGGRLRVRNRIYRRIFDAGWISRGMPGAELQRLRSAYRRGAVRTAAAAAAILLALTAWALTSYAMARRSQRLTEEAVQQQREMSFLAVDLRRTAAERGEAVRSLERSVWQAKQLRLAASTREMESRARLLHLLRANASAALSRGDVYVGLLWAAEGVRLDDRPDSPDRLRYGAVLAHAPSLLALWSDVEVADLSPDGRWAATVRKGGEVRVWATTASHPVEAQTIRAPYASSVAFSPDSRSLAIYGGKLLRFVAPGARRLLGAERLLSAPICSLAWSWDSSRVATYSLDGMVHLCNASAPGGVPYTFRCFAGAGRVAMGPNRDLVAAATPSGNAYLLDLPNGKQLTSTPVLGDILDVAVSPVGPILATASRPYYNAGPGLSGGALWLPGFERAAAPAMEQAGGCSSIRFSPDGRRVVTTGANHHAQTWDAATGRALGPPIELGSPGTEAMFDVGGERLVTAAQSTGARVWTADGEPLAPLLSSASGADAVRLSAYGDLLLVHDARHQAWLWRLAGHASRPLSSNATCVAISPADGKVAIGDRNGGSWIVDAGIAPGRPMRLSRGALVEEFAFSPDGRLIALAGRDGAVRAYGVSDRSLRFTISVGGPATNLCFSKDGGRLAAVSSRRAVVCESAGGRLVRAFVPSGSGYRSIGLDPRGTTAVIADAGDRVTFLDVRTGRRLGAYQHAGDVNAIDFTADGKVALTASSDGTVCLWNARTAAPVRKPYAYNHPICHACFSPDGSAVAVATGEQDGSGPRAAHLWSVSTGKPLTPPLEHRGAVRHVAFSGDGRMVVTSSVDNSLRVWDAATGEPITQPLQMPGQVYMSLFSPDGRRVLAACNTGATQVWDLPRAIGPHAQLAALAGVLSGKRIDSAGGVVDLTPEAQRLAEASLRLGSLPALPLFGSPGADAQKRRRPRFDDPLTLR